LGHDARCCFELAAPIQQGSAGFDTAGIPPQRGTTTKRKIKPLHPPETTQPRRATWNRKLNSRARSYAIQFSIFKETAEMSDMRKFTSSAGAIAAAILVISLSQFKIASATTQQPNNIQSMATTEPVALYITLCLWSKQRPAPMCREVPLTPGAAGPDFVSMKACQDGQEEAMRRWRAEAGPVFGFTEAAGDGYRIEAKYCRPVVDRARVRE
jgi:hypothetical protein